MTHPQQSTELPVLGYMNDRGIRWLAGMIRLGAYPCSRVIASDSDHNLAKGFLEELERRNDQGLIDIVKKHYHRRLSDEDLSWIDRNNDRLLIFLVIGSVIFLSRKTRSGPLARLTIPAKGWFDYHRPPEPDVYQQHLPNPQPGMKFLIHIPAERRYRELITAIDCWMEPHDRKLKLLNELKQERARHTLDHADLAWLDFNSETQVDWCHKKLDEKKHNYGWYQHTPLPQGHKEKLCDLLGKLDLIGFMENSSAQQLVVMSLKRALTQWKYRNRPRPKMQTTILLSPEAHDKLTALKKERNMTQSALIEDILMRELGATTLV